MQKLALVCIILFLTSSLYAEDYSKVIDNLEEVNSTLNSEKLNPKISKCLPSNQKINHSKNCIEKICKKASSFDNNQEIFDKVADNKDIVLTGSEELFSLLKKRIDKSIDMKLMILKRLEIFLKKKDLKIDNDLKRLHAVTLILTLFKNTNGDEYEDYLLDHKNLTMEYKLNKAKVKEKLQKYFIPSQVGPMSKAFQSLIKTKEIANLLYSSQFGVTEVGIAKYPGKNIKEIIKRESKKAIKTLKVIKENMGSTFDKVGGLSQIIDLEMFQSISQSQNPSSTMLEDFFYTLHNLEILNNFYHKNIEIPDIEQIETNNLSELFNLSFFKTKITQVIKELKEMKKDKKRRDEEILKCRAIISNNLEGLPTEKVKREFIKNAKFLKKKVKDLIISNFSDSSSKELDSFFSGVFLSLPDSKKQFSKSFKLRIKEYLANSKNDFKLYKNNLNNNKDKNQTLFELLELINWNKDKMTDDLSSICQSFELKGSEDASYNIGSGSLTIGWNTLKNPKIAEGILAHEYAHALGNYFNNKVTSQESLEKYLGPRLCLNKLHINIQSNRREKHRFFDKKNEIQSATSLISQYTEEDWADLLASTLTSPDHPNYLCYTAEQYLDEYADLEIFKKNDKYHHSPDLFRVMHMEFLKKGKLPTSCLNAIKKEQPNYKFKKCKI